MQGIDAFDINITQFYSILKEINVYSKQILKLV